MIWEEVKHSLDVHKLPFPMFPGPPGSSIYHLSYHIHGVPGSEVHGHAVRALPSEIDAG